MTTVYCKKLHQKLPALSFSPFPGPLGEKLTNEISQQAWDMWLAHQTKLINEYRLDPLETKSKDFLHKEMMAFLYHDMAHNPPDFKEIDSSK